MKNRRNVLITGGAGFIGSNLVDFLLQKGYCVTVIDNLSTGSLENIEPFSANPDFSLFHYDLALNKFVEDIHADVIFHFASAVGVDLVVSSPEFTLTNNFNATANTIEIARKSGARLILASSSEVYGNTSHVPMNEDQCYELGPCNYSRWSYAASKISDEFLASAYAKEGNDCYILRLFNVIGTNQSGKYGMVVPRFIKSALNNETLTVYGDGKQTRSFCDIRDIVVALEKFVHYSDENFNIFNLGSANEISIMDLARKTVELSNSSSRIGFVSLSSLPQGFAELDRRVPDISKAKKALNWEAKFSLDVSLKNIIEHYKGNDRA